MCLQQVDARGDRVVTSNAENHDFSTESENSTPNIMFAVIRRWPWVVVGTGLGLVIGFFALYLARPHVYQSSAQLLVVKKRSDLMTGSDARLSMLEDYVATQVTFIKSEQILSLVARKMAPEKVESPILKALASDPDPNRNALMGYLQTVLTVARERDPTSPAAGTNVLNLVVRGGFPRDCVYVLETVITVYKEELDSLYDAESQRQIKEYDEANKKWEEEIRTLSTERAKSASDMYRITPEDLMVIRGRVSRSMDALRQMEQDRAELLGKLELIKSAGNESRTRMLILAQIRDVGQGQVQVGRTEVDDPETGIASLELQRAQLLKRFGEDHAMIQEIDARVQFLREFSDRRIPKDGGVPFDELTIHSRVLEYRFKHLEDQIKLTLADLEKDKSDLIKASELQGIIDEATRKITDRDRKIDENRVLKTRIQVTQSSGGYEASVINKPSLNPVPIAPKLSQALLLGAVGGLLLGFGLATLAEYADKSFRTPAEIRAKLGLPVIGHIPPIRTHLPVDQAVDVESNVVCALRPKSVEAEAYRGVRTALYFSTKGKGHQIIQVTSPSQGDGKSTLAANLAVCIAQSGKRILLVDCDLRRPKQNRYFHVAELEPGLASVISGEVMLQDAVRTTAVENLFILPCGARPANPAELLTSPEFQSALDAMRTQYDIVLLDTPPILAVSDPSVVAPRADGVLMVLRMTGRARPLAERAREQLSQLGANVLGVIVNGAGQAADGYGYGSGTGYQYAYEYQDGYHDDDPAQS